MGGNEALPTDALGNRLTLSANGHAHHISLQRGVSGLDLGGGQSQVFAYDLVGNRDPWLW